jgi:hypothetical protein
MMSGKIAVRALHAIPLSEQLALAERLVAKDVAGTRELAATWRDP